MSPTPAQMGTTMVSPAISRETVAELRTSSDGSIGTGTVAIGLQCFPGKRGCHPAKRCTVPNQYRGWARGYVPRWLVLEPEACRWATGDTSRPRYRLHFRGYTRAGGDRPWLSHSSSRRDYLPESPELGGNQFTTGPKERCSIRDIAKLVRLLFEHDGWQPTVPVAVPNYCAGGLE